MMPARSQHATGCGSGVQRRHWLLGCAATLAGCDRGAARPAAAVLHMGMDLWAGYFPVLLAIELGMMAERGLTIEVSMPGNTDRMMAEFAAGRYDIVGMALADLVNLTRGAHDVQVFIHSDESYGGDKLLSRSGFDPDAGRMVVGTNLGRLR
jgi:NitT/TauT family transport system substrate-binding protein